MSDFSDTQRPFPANLGSKGWIGVLAYGILLVFGGIVAFFNPIAAGFATGVLFGMGLILYGVFAIAAGVSALSTRSKILEILLGIIAILAGAFVLFDPFQGAASLGWAIGLWLLVSGILQLIYVFQGGHDRIWRALLGVIDIVLGGYLVISGPITGLAFVAALVGFSFLFRGFFLMSLAFTLRRIGRS